MIICYLTIKAGNNLLQNRALTCPKNGWDFYAFFRESDRALSSIIYAATKTAADAVITNV